MYDSIIIGGGIAGLQASIQLGRMLHKVAVIDAGAGRSALCKSYHNVLGWPHGVSGEHLRKLGRLQAEGYGVEFVAGQATGVTKNGETFVVEVQAEAPSKRYEAHTLLVATGVMDRFPALPGLVDCLGLSVYVCPDCDGYEVRNRRTIVMGAGNTGANMALTLSYFSDRIVFVNHERKKIDDPLRERLGEKGIGLYEEEIGQVLTQPGQPGMLRGVRLESGAELTAERGFIAFGGNEVRSSVVEGLGVERLENKHIATDPRTKMTNVPRVWAAGDIGVHAEQLTVAMGEGALAAIWMHKELLVIKQGAAARSRSTRE